MKKFLLLFILISCSKKFPIHIASNLEEMKCLEVENCLSSMQTGDNYILPLKMKGEDATQNISNIEKIAKKLGQYNILNNGLNLSLIKESLQIEFMADQENRVIHVRSQVGSVGMLGSKKGLSDIEEIRFKFNQNDF